VKLLATTREYVQVPFTGPPGVPDLTVFPVEMAIVPEGSGEPASAGPAWKPAVWLNGQASLLLSEGDYPAGDYVVYARITAGLERPVMLSGRLRVGAAA
jgi:hypothetical protein